MRYRIDSMSLRGGELIIDGWAFGDSEIGHELRHADGSRLEAKVVQRERADVMQRYGAPLMCGFTIKASFDREDEVWLCLTDGRNVKRIHINEKELEEQQIVTDSIVAALKSRGLAPVVGDRFTRVAAQVEHLCTPISAEVRLSGDRLNEILCALHPTPAVGGYPKAEAKAWIDRVEPHRRRYYGGYLGPVRVDGVRLFVNLRCLEANNSLLRLYVGGGLTAQSQPASEWCETEAKAQTLLSVING